MKNFKKLLGSVREFKAAAIVTVIFIILEVFIEVVIPFITADMVNAIKDGAALSGVVRTGLFLVFLAVLSLASGATAGYLGSKASSGFARNLRHDIYCRVQDFSFENIDRFSSASLVTRMTTDIGNVQMAFMMVIRIAIRAPLMFLFAIVMAYVMGGALATTFLILIPVLVAGLLLIARKAMPAFRAVFRKYDKLNESIEENVRAMRVVKGFAATIDVGQLSALLTSGFQILMSLMMISMIYVMLTMSAESMKRLAEVLDETPTLTNPENPVYEVADGSVDFENVSFKYSRTARKNALENVNLHIASGMTVGVLGGTGSSKSTLVQLIPRLYDVTEGCVKVGGRDVREYDLDTLRNNVAVVLQKNLLFSGTIKDNLRWGNENATDEEMEAACRLAQADEFIRSFPDGYDTRIEQGGSNVSGGQKQRLCIARALLKKPKILILDDSTSAVDTHTDALIRAGFRSYIPETTKIIIAQRVASVQDADLILVMDNGVIAAAGTHDELMKTNDIYRETYLQQNKGGDEQ